MPVAPPPRARPPPHLPQPDPPVVPYHDLRTVVRAAWAGVGQAAPPTPRLTRAAVLAVAADSVAELRRREAQHGTLVASDLLEIAARPQMRTINHPGNDLFAAMAVRIRAALGLAARPTRLTRPLLNGLHAPVEPAVADVFGDVAARAGWVVEGAVVDVETIEAAQLRWYEGRPDVVAEIVGRSERQLAHLGLVAPRSERWTEAQPSTER